MLQSFFGGKLDTGVPWILHMIEVWKCSIVWAFHKLLFCPCVLLIHSYKACFFFFLVDKLWSNANNKESPVHLIWNVPCCVKFLIILPWLIVMSLYNHELLLPNCYVLVSDLVWRGVCVCRHTYIFDKWRRVWFMRGRRRERENTF